MPYLHYYFLAIALLSRIPLSHVCVLRKGAVITASCALGWDASPAFYDFLIHGSLFCASLSLHPMSSALWYKKYSGTISCAQVRSSGPTV